MQVIRGGGPARKGGPRTTRVLSEREGGVKGKGDGRFGAEDDLLSAGKGCADGSPRRRWYGRNLVSTIQVNSITFTCKVA